MNLKHPCPPLQSYLLLNRFGGEQGYSVHTCAPLIVNSRLHHFLKRERKTCCGFCVGEKNQSDTILCLPCCYCVALLSGFSWACLHFDGFCLLSARGKADAKKSRRVSALASEAVDCGVQRRGHAL